MSCCALGTCLDPRCDLCVRVARLPQPMSHADRSAKYAEAAAVAVRPSRDPSRITRRRRAIAKTLTVRREEEPRSR